jgi:hypothetical protein
MSLAEIFLSYLPLMAAVVFMIVVVRKSGLLQLRSHRQRVEQLLERIAAAVEANNKK